jgi:very-short-patch-repair endonuclease
VPSFGGATVRCVARCYGPLPLGSERYTQAMDPLRHVTRVQKFALARRLRRAATPAERHAWSVLRNRGVLGLKFRRQHVVHGFIVDFYCLAERLVLELEGDAHDGNDRRMYDAARERFLEAAGYRVVRVRNSDVVRARLEALLRHALRRRPIVPPLPKGEGARG